MSFVNRKEVRRSNTLMALEASIVGYILYLTLGVVNKTTLSPAPALGDLVLYIGLFTSLVILSALSVGLYESKLRETFRGIIRRIFVSVALGYFLMEIIVNTVLTDIQLHQYFFADSCGSVNYYFGNFSLFHQSFRLTWSRENQDYHYWRW